MSLLSHLSVSIAGYPVCESSPDDLAIRINRGIDNSQKTILFFANTNFIVNCMLLRNSFFNKDVVIVNDGLGMDVGCLLTCGRKFKFNLNGTDFMPYFFLQSQKTLRVFLIGATPIAINGAADYLEQELGHIVVGRCDGYDGLDNTRNLVELINQATADVILVALGNPSQETWILENYQLINAKFFAGVGGLFDFWSGVKPRAPQWMQNVRMEWLFRLSIEPKRLYKRYTVDVLKFLLICVKERK